MHSSHLRRAMFCRTVGYALADEGARVKAQGATDTGATEGGTWRELAVARSLDPARVRAEKRVQRFLHAALDLMQRSPDKEITVHEVVERSGQSPRSFYQYFAGKHEFLLALVQDSVRSTPE